MRYTLRLLTAQQFQRAATLICACEPIVVRSPDDLGDVPISLGLWVGGRATPEPCKAPEEYLGDARCQDPQPRSSVPARPVSRGAAPRSCPRPGSEDPAAYGIDAIDQLRVLLPGRALPFPRRLPVQVVDEDLYRRPPTLLIGTVDKFARLAVGSNARACSLGTRDTSRRRLIIQDELHLISGPARDRSSASTRPRSTALHRD